MSQGQMFIALSQFNSNDPEQMVNWCQLQDLGETQNDTGFTSPQNNHDGVQVPSFNLKLIVVYWSWLFLSLCHDITLL